MNQVKKSWRGALAWFLAFLMVCSVITPVAIPRKAKAEDAQPSEPYIQIGEKYYTSGMTYNMENSIVTLTTRQNCTWEQKTGPNSVEMLASESDTVASDKLNNMNSIVIKAKDFGNSEIVASYTDTNGDNQSILLRIHVGFSVNYGSAFTILGGKPVLILNQGDRKKLDLIFKFKENSEYQAVWSSSNQDVFCVSKDGTTTADKVMGNEAYVSGTGAGKATLVLETQDKSVGDSEKRKEFDVYVLPAVKKGDGQEKWITKSVTWSMNSGDSFYINTKYDKNLGEDPDKKIAWAVTKIPDNDIGTSNDKYQFLTDSSGSPEVANRFSPKEIEKFSITTSDVRRNQYTINGVAGKYKLYIFLAGTYKPDSNVQNNSDDIPIVEPFNENENFAPIVIDFSISANRQNMSSTKTKIDLSMIAGDSLDLADFFGTSVPFLQLLFGSPSVDPEEEGRIDQSKLGEEIVSLEPNATGTVTVTLTGKEILSQNSTDQNSWSSIANGLTKNDTITITIHISSKFELNKTSAIIYKGSSIQLSTLLSPNEPASYEWTSDDTDCATVKPTGQGRATVTAKKKSDKVTITVVCTLSNGLKRTATCKLQILDAVSSIKFDKKSLEVEAEGDPGFLNVEIEKNQTGFQNLLWRSSDEKIVTVEPMSEDSLSARVQGHNVGTAVVWVENADNYVYATCEVRVYSGVTSIKFINVTKPVRVNKAQKYLQLDLEVTLSDGTTIGLPDLKKNNVDLIWESGDENVFKVENDLGLLELKGSGTTTITVRSKYAPKINDYLDITVGEQSSGLSINPSSVTVEQGSKVTLEYKLSPADSGAEITWSSLDTKIATVTQKGVVSGVKAGQTYIIAKTDDGQVATALVTVTQKASGITLDVYNITVGVGDSYTVSAKPNPVTSTETSFTWTSKDPSIATVKDGVVTGVKAGQTIILVKSSTGSVEYLYVTVQQDVLGMKLNYSEKEIAKGKTFTLKAVFNPSDVTNTNVKWASSDEKIATVNTKGKVKGIKGGTAVITAVSEDGGYLDYCIVSVTQLTTGIKLNYSSKKVPLKGKVTLKATISGNTSKNQTLKWTSSNTSIATVSKKGVVTAKSKVGSCVITCRTTDGSGEKATCKIRVYRKVTSISLNKSTMKIREGKTYRIKATLRPSNATYKSVTWSSTDPEVATVDSKGYITGVKTGSCKIYATAKDGSKKKAACWVYVLENVPSTAVTLESSNMLLVRGTKSVINYSLSPANSTDTVTFTSNNKSVATVSASGNVTAKRVGTATITIRSSSGKRALLTVTVIGLNKTTLRMEQYDTDNLWIEGATNVVWDSSNPSVATVSGGKVTARKTGTATITASVNGVKMYCTVIVRPIKK